MKSVSESYLGLRCIVETESASLFASQVESRPLSDKVWFFVYIPQFFLQSLVKKLIRKNAYVLVDSCEDDPVVQQLNDSAKALGVCKDMPLSLIDKLGNVKIFSRDKEREKNAIDDLLVWANKFSPLIVDKFPDGLLVEMKGSLKLFGGQEKLIKIMSDELQIRGYKFNLAIGLTPLLAEISAKIGWKGDISNRFAYKKINNVPISVLSFLPKQFDVLNKMGVRTLGDCQKLPRKGLAERFGKDIMLQFDRLYGYSPDPQTFFTAASKKSILMAIDGDVGNWSELKFHIKKLIKKTNKYLLSRSLKVRRATWFFYGPSFEVNVPISLSSANNISVVLRILQEKLRDKRFKGPIDSVRLFLDEVENTRPANLNILCKAKADANLLCNEFIDLIRSRYGEKSLYILTRKEEHVPENSFTYCHSFDGRQNESSSADDVLPKIKRPIWFIDPPVRLSVKKNQPLYDGQSLSVFERERIVSGWWNGEEIARDYFVAENHSGMLLWIYKELGSKKNWFFQGLFE